MREQSNGSNETMVTGITEKDKSGYYTAITLSQSKAFKTKSAAVKWMAKRGYDENGNRTSN